MTDREAVGDGAWLVARLLAGAPATEVDPAQLSEPWASLAQTIVQAGRGKRLPAFEGALSCLPSQQAAEIRAWVGKAGRAILQGQATGIATPQGNCGDDVPALPEAARLTPALQQNGQGAGIWLTDYVDYATNVSERTPRLFHEACGLWLAGLLIARRLRLRLRHGDLYPNLYVLGVASTTLYAKSTGLEITSKLVHECGPHSQSGHGAHAGATASLRSRALLLPDDLVRPARGHATVFAAYSEQSRADQAIFHAELTPFFKRRDWKLERVRPVTPFTFPRPIPGPQPDEPSPAQPEPAPDLSEQVWDVVERLVDISK